MADSPAHAAAEGNLELIRASVRALCAEFPGEYWQRVDRERAYPTEFVTALTRAGFLAALIPEEYGGSGLGLQAAAAILEEIHGSGCNGSGCHAPDVHDGHAAAARQRGTEAAVAAADRGG